MTDEAKNPDIRPDADGDIRSRVVVCGSRGWTDEALIEGVISEMDPHSAIIVTGGARGADDMAAEIATRYGFKVEVYEADWTRWGHSAGFRRNELMCHLPRVCQVVAFWDGKSRGTGDTIRRAKDMGLPVTMYGPYAGWFTPPQSHNQEQADVSGGVNG